MATYLVTGASGTVGSNIVKDLVAQGHQVRATTSRKDATGKKGNVETVLVNLATGEGIAAALKGVDGAFLLAPPGYADQQKNAEVGIVALHEKSLPLASTLWKPADALEGYTFLR